MNHEQAIQELTTERYLLDELSPEQREAFEEHMFDCAECAFDVRAGNVFLTEAKEQLPQIAAQKPAAETPRNQPVREKKSWWRVFAMPALAAPAFAALLAVIAFQNFSTIPSLRSAATEPRIIAPSSLHADTRGGEPLVLQAERKQGVNVLIDIPQGYASYEIALTDPQGKRFWAATVAAPETGTLSLTIPGAGLQQGAYILNLAGLSTQGARTELARRILEIHLNE